MLEEKNFGNAQLERLYRQQQLRQHAAQLVYVLCTFTAALLLIALNHLPNPDATLLLATITAAFALGLNIVLNIQHHSTSRQYRTQILSGIWLTITVILTLSAGAQHAILPVLIANFALYTLFPFGILSTIALCLILSLAQILSFILLSQNSKFVVDQLLATILVHFWSNFIGIYLHSMRNRLCRAAFLNARNAVSSEREARQENAKMCQLLGSALPPHVIASVQTQLGGTQVPKIYVEHYSKVSLVYAKLYGIQAILNQIGVQDAARLLNDFSQRIDQLILRYNFVRIQTADALAIVAISGIPITRDDHALWACHFSLDLNTLFRSFSNATTADLQLRIGIATGSISAGIIGARKWHYDVIGMAFDNAKLLESQANLSTIVISDDTKSLIEGEFAFERIDQSSWCLLHALRARDCTQRSTPIPILPPVLLFPSNQRRFSLVTVAQAIHRILQSVTVIPTNSSQSTSNCMIMGFGAQTAPINSAGMGLRGGTNAPLGRRKKKNGSENEKTRQRDAIEDLTLNDALHAHNWMHVLTLRFADVELERAFHAQMDRWFIPALAIAILFLIIYGIYQVLVMPRLFITVLLVILALCALLVVLLVLYVNYFETFCQFITQTAAGHSIAILLIIVILFMCGIVNTFSCPATKVLLNGSVCHIVHYSIVSCVLWMLTCTVFVRFSALAMLTTLSLAIVVYGAHIFVTHSILYTQFSELIGWRIEFDLLIALITLAVLIFLQARRNEKLIRLDFLSVLKTVEANAHLEKLEYLNEQILLNALPAHIAHHYPQRMEPYAHACPAVGFLSARFGDEDITAWQGAFGFDRLNRIIFEVDEMVSRYHGVEKLRSSHCVYTAAVGILPETHVNVNDTPYTIGDLLASLTAFALQMGKVADTEGIDISIGIDCGPALAIVIGAERPRYEIYGLPCSKAAKLMEANRSANLASNSPINTSAKIFVSEEIFLALRPRADAFRFDERHPLSVAPALTGYQLLLPGQKIAQQQVMSTVAAPKPPLVNKAEMPQQPPIAIVAPQNLSHQKLYSINTKQINNITKNYEEDNFANRERFESVESETDFEDSEDINSEDYNNSQYSEDENQNKCFNKSFSIALPSDLQALTRDVRLNGELYTQQRILEAKNRKSPLNNINSRIASRSNSEKFSSVPKNPLEMFSSMNSSLSSELYSIDLSVETDSEMEWITPEMIAARNLHNENPQSKMENGVMKKFLNAGGTNNKASCSVTQSPQTGQHPLTTLINKEGTQLPYKGERARQYSDFSDLENLSYRQAIGSRNGQFSSAHMRRKRMRLTVQRNGPKLPASWLGSSRTSCASSELSLFSSQKGSLCALDRLNQAARRVDKMLLELAHVENSNQKNSTNSGSTNMLPDCIPFPVGSSGAVNKPPTGRISIHKTQHRRELSSSACHTEYDNAESEDFDEVYDDEDENMVDDFESTKSDLRSMSMSGRLEELKKLLMGERRQKPNDSELEIAENSAFSRFRKAALTQNDETNENIPLLKTNSNDLKFEIVDHKKANNQQPSTSSRLSPLFPGRLIPSMSNGGKFVNGNEADIDSNCSSMAVSRAGLDRIRWKSVHSIGYDNEYEFNNYSSDPDEAESTSGLSRTSSTALSLNLVSGAFAPETRNFLAIDDGNGDIAPEEQILDARGQVYAIARDIRKNFGDYQLASFSDIDIE